MVNFGIIIQARSNSSRYKDKIFKNIYKKKNSLDILVARLRQSKKVKFIALAVPSNDKTKRFQNIIKKNKIYLFKGSEKNVLSRYYKCAKFFNIKNIIRITSDCPLICPKLLDKMIKLYNEKKVDYCSNTIHPSFPDGFDIEIFNFKSLCKSYENAKTNYHKEHVTKYIINNNQFKKYNFINSENLSHYRLTLDYPEDLKVLKKVLSKLKKNIRSDYQEIITLIKNSKNLFNENINFFRNESEYEGPGQKLWIKAQSIIPGGSMLFSKNPDLYLPKKWPAYFVKTSKSNIWSLDRKKYLDMCLMGVGTNILGYSNKEVDNAVLKTIKNGNLSTLNNPEEILLAEKLLEIHPWADMVRHVRTGAESNSLAIRLARAYTGKNKIAVCGYHGWQDWYLSANLNNPSSLNNHLLKNLSVKGVDKNLKNTVKIFDFNDKKILQLLEKSSNFAAIIIELARDIPQEKNFLEKIRKLCNKKNIILIFDECTSGFRETNGGLHLKFGINPDIATFGKALGNGYSICSVLGKRDIMNQAKNTFASSTFWTDRVGPTAGIKTLEVMKRLKSWNYITNLGKTVKKNLAKISKDVNLPILIVGLDAMPKFYFKENHNIYKTYISQEFLKKNILASNTIYLCTTHNEKMIKNYISIMHEIFLKIKKNEEKNNYPFDLLEKDQAIVSIRG